MVRDSEGKDQSSAPIERELTRFGIFELDLRRRELRRKGVKVALQQQPFDILRLLVAHRGDFVSRELIQSTLWPDGRFVDFERSINTAMMKLRQALRENASAPTYIETVPRAGYRLIAPILESVVTSGDAKPAIGAIAILPLQDLSAEPDGQYFVDGLTDALITEMARRSHLRVVSRMTMVKYVNARQSMREIAQELNVQAIVEGSILRAENRIRISARLLDAIEDRHLWAQTYDRDLKDILMLQQELATAIVGSATRALIEGDAPRPRPLNPQAYENFLRGNFLCSQRALKPYQRAISCYETAISLEPEWGPPHSGLAEVWRRLDFNSHAYDAARIAKVIALARKGVELDPDCAIGHATLGAALAMHQWQWKEGERYLRHALQLDGQSSHVNALYASVRLNQCQYDEALRYIDAALAADHSSMYVRSYRVLILLLSNRVAEAARDSEDMLEDRGEFALGHMQYGATLLELGRAADALGAFERSLVGNIMPMSLIGLAHAHRELGQPEESSAAIDRILKLHAVGECAPSVVALAHAVRGDFDAAIDLFEKAFDEHDIRLPIYSQARPAHPLRSDPRFKCILERVHMF